MAQVYKKYLSTLLRSILREEIDRTNLQLRVSTNIKSVLGVLNKYFSLCDNYPKGRGYLFCECIETNHPVALLLHIKRAYGSCQDLSFEGSGAVYMNRSDWIELLYECLRKSRDNIPQENIFIVLS